MSTGQRVDGEWQGDAAGLHGPGCLEEGRFELHCALPLPDDLPPSQWEMGNFGPVGDTFLLAPFWSICREYGIECPRPARSDGRDHTLRDQ